jgi:hypothetical protein
LATIGYDIDTSILHRSYVDLLQAHSLTTMSCDHITSLCNRLENVQQTNEKDRPYVILCLFVLRQAINDAHTHHSSHDRQRTHPKMIRNQQIVSEDARRFLNGKGLEVWLKTSGIKCITAQQIRAMAERPKRMYFSRQDVHNFEDV